MGEGSGRGQVKAILAATFLFAAAPEQLTGSDCGSFHEMTQQAIRAYGEQLYLTVYDDEYDMQIQVWINPKTNEYHVLMVRGSTACTLSTGSKTIFEKWGKTS